MTLAVAVVIGGLIGSVGIGGVLLVPWLTEVIGLGVREAVCIAMASYLATGVVAIVQSRYTPGADALRGYWLLMLATLPGAFLGSIALTVIPERGALLILAAFLVLTGGWTLLRRQSSPTVSVGARPGWMTGLVSGFASALTGTGGPTVLMPMLMWRGVPLLAAVALGQMVQLPIAAAATVGNVATGPFDYGAAILVAAALAPGVVLGRWTALRVPVGIITRIVAVVLIATGAMLAARTM
jgi:uncharacterized membrane protein YfcA